MRADRMLLAVLCLARLAMAPAAGQAPLAMPAASSLAARHVLNGRPGEPPAAAAGRFAMGAAAEVPSALYQGSAALMAPARPGPARAAP